MRGSAQSPNGQEFAGQGEQVLTSCSGRCQPQKLSRRNHVVLRMQLDDGDDGCPWKQRFFAEPKIAPAGTLIFCEVRKNFVFSAWIIARCLNIYLFICKTNKRNAVIAQQHAHLSLFNPILRKQSFIIEACHMPGTVVGCHLLCSGFSLARGVVLQLFVQTYHRLLSAFWHFYN